MKSKIKIKPETFLLILIIFFAAILRIYKLDKIPNGLSVDEALIGYDAYSILKTGRDHHGKLFPFYPEGFTWGINPIFIYSLIPFIKIFDLSLFTIRFVSALWGILIVIGTFFLVKEIFNEKVALISSFLVSISPWALQYSRIAWELITTPPFVIFGIFFLIRGVKKLNKKNIFLGSFLLALSTYTYATAKLFSPILFLGFILIYQNFFRKHKKLFLIAIITFLISGLPVFYNTFFGIGSSRFSILSIFNQDTLNRFRDELNSKYNFTPGINLLIKSDYFVYFYIFINNYLKHISLDFLFFIGDPILRHSIRGFGQLYIFELPLVIGGIFLIIKKRNEISKLILLWLILFPVASSLTGDRIPHASRTFIAIPIFQIISAVFIFKIYDWLKIPSHYNLKSNKSIKKIFLKNFIIVLLFLYLIGSFANIILYFYNYFFIYPIYSGPDWDYGWDQIVRYFNENNQKYDRIILTNKFLWPWMRFYFYNKVEPSAKGVNVDSFYDYIGPGNIKICDLDKCPEIPGRNLYIESWDIKEWLANNTQYKIIGQILYPSGDVAYYLIENN
jgi:4-amino-4-deoxy-L-arabinose transferase-like glycosyltransferase